MKNVVNAVEKYKELILSAERQIWSTPETGYKEQKTSAYLAEQFEAFGYELKKADGITGFYTVVDTGRAGPEVLVLAELDAVVCRKHKAADENTGAVHACGHHTQCAALLGVAAALKEEGVLSSLCGKIRLCAVPAEEFLEIEYRLSLKEKGVIEYLGGKCEFLRRGYFDGVDMAILIHAGDKFCAEKGMIGFLAKRVTYKGVAAHAGGAPWNGTNALYAANCGLNAVNALRETFQEKDLVRWHPIVTNGGALVNAIPDEVTIESQLRASSFEAIDRENKKIDRALIGGALSFGARIEITDVGGYSPFLNDEGLLKVASDGLKAIYPNRELSVYDGYATGSSDMGDLACIMPVLMAYVGGARGGAHTKDFEIVDPILACVDGAKWQLAILTLLLREDAKLAKEIIKAYRPKFGSKEEFLAYQSARQRSLERIRYLENGAEIDG